jgi:hypothetical protein
MACIDVTSDSNNCGSCDHECPIMAGTNTYQLCVAGECVCNPAAGGCFCTPQSTLNAINALITTAIGTAGNPGTGLSSTSFQVRIAAQKDLETALCDDFDPADLACAIATLAQAVNPDLEVQTRLRQSASHVQANCGGGGSDAGAE